MADHLKKVARGDPFNYPAQLYNDVIDTVRDYLRRVRDGGGVEFDGTFRPTIVQVKNGTGADLARYSVVGIESAIDDPGTEEDQFLNGVRLTGRAPSSPDDLGRFAVYVGGVSDGSIGHAVVSGVVIVKVDEGDGSGFADVADGVTDSLIATASGTATVIWRATGSGKQWAVVRIGGGGALPAGQYDGMVLQTTSQLTLGAGFLRLVNVPPV